MDWFLYDIGLRHERVKRSYNISIILLLKNNLIENCSKIIKIEMNLRNGLYLH